jgi:hypothetical protein
MRLSKKDLSEKQPLEQVVEGLDKVMLAIALQGRPKEEQIKYLASFDYSNSEMANILAIPKGTIDGIRANLSKGARRK